MVVELKLSATDTRGSETHGFVHPNDDFVIVAIRDPSGRTVLFQPMLRHCVDEDHVIRAQSQDKPAVYDSAYIGYGRDGLYFDAAGAIRHPCDLPCGRRVEGILERV